MTKYLHVATFCFVTINSFGQTVWCPAGAQWHYGFGAWNYSGYVELNYVDDTVYNGIACHQLDQHIESITYPDNDTTATHQPVYTYESDGIVYGAFRRYPIGTR